MAYLRQHRYRRGKGFIGRFVNRAIDSLSFKLHVPGGYQFCGTGTHLSERLARGDDSINPLNRVRRLHDIAYRDYKRGKKRKMADEELVERVVSSGASLNEKSAALGVAGVMKLKSTSGGGVKVEDNQKSLAERGGKRRMGQDKQRRHDAINVLQQTAKMKGSIHSKARCFQQSETPSSLRDKRTSYDHIQPFTSPHPTTPEQRLKLEVENTRSIIRNKLKALRQFETLRDDFLNIYLTTPMKNAFKDEMNESNNRVHPPWRNDMKRVVNTENNEEEEQIHNTFSSSGPLDFNIEDSHLDEANDNLQRVFLQSPRTDDSAFQSTEPPWTHYIHALAHADNADAVSGPHFRSDTTTGDRTLYIGRSKMEIHDNGTITIDHVNYEPRIGLLELLFKKQPNLDVVEEIDWNNYKKILQHSNAHREGYNLNGDILATNAWKYKNVFATLFPPPPTYRGERTLRTKTMRQRKASSEYGKKSGSSLRFVNTPDYKYWRDPNQLVRRLHLLLASQNAGNGSHQGEIIEIENELRDAGIIV